jgi:hypothetical protein
VTGAQSRTRCPCHVPKSTTVPTSRVLVRDPAHNVADNRRTGQPQCHATSLSHGQRTDGHGAGERKRISGGAGVKHERKACASVRAKSHRQSKNVVGHWLLATGQIEKHCSGVMHRPPESWSSHTANLVPRVTFRPDLYPPDNKRRQSTGVELSLPSSFAFVLTKVADTPDVTRHRFSRPRLFCTKLR